MSEVDCCCATVWKRDCLRRCGGKRHFKMHYTKEQCSRAATHDGRCWQHQDKGKFVSESNHYRRVEHKIAKTGTHQ